MLPLVVVTPAGYLVCMPMKYHREQDLPAAARRVEDLLAAAGLRAIRVDRCPDPACPVCARLERAAA